MKFLPAFILSLLLGAGVAHAQLDQTEDAVNAAFGKPFGAPHTAGAIKIATYRTTANEITVGFKDGKAIYLIYRKSSGAEWAPAEVTALLSSNVPGGNGHEYWEKTTGTVRAQYHIDGTSTAHMGNVQSWQLYKNKNLQAEFHPELKVVVIWDSAGGLDGAAILTQNPL